MANSQELNARERKRVYMHSTIFDNGGPTSKSIYGQNQQKEINAGLAGSLKTRAPPAMDLPRACDARQTQNAGHGVVIPSNVGVDRRGVPERDGQDMRNGSMPRTSGTEVLVADGNPMPILKAGGKDREVIPQEFWQTSVNMQWHDTRNEAARQNKNRNTDLGAQELKLHELSSEIFGKARLRNCSTSNPGADLLSTEADYLQTDSSLNPNLRQERKMQSQSNAFDRVQSNLAASNQNTMSRSDQAAPPPICSEEDPSTIPRRRQEKNFSDLFGTQMGERRDIKDREEVLATHSCSFLDSRSEIAARNKAGWRANHSDVQGADQNERPNVASLRTEAEQSSNLFDRGQPQKPRANAADVQVSNDERACWDTKDIMQGGSEVARRSRNKDRNADVHSQNRKHEDLASQQVRRGLGGEYDDSEPQFSPRGGDIRSNRLTTRLTDSRNGQFRPQSRSMAQQPCGRPDPASDRPSTAKDKKLAFLQSSIFG